MNSPAFFLRAGRFRLKTMLPVLLLAAALSPQLRATEENAAKEESAKEEAPVAVADFSPALRELAALGMPDLRNARWVEDQRNVLGELVGSRRQFEGNVAWQEIELARRRAWVQAEAGDAPPRVWLPGAALPWRDAEEERDGLFAGMPAARQAEYRELLAQERGNSLRQLGRMPAADLAADLGRIIAGVEKAAGEMRRVRDDYEREWKGERNRMVNGALLLFAAQIYQHGNTEQASRLAAALCKNSPDWPGVWNSAIEQLADAQCRAATRTLLESGDWEGYAEQLQTLVKKVARGWKSRAAVERLLELARRRVDGVAPAPLPVPEDAVLDAKTVAALDALLAERTFSSAEESGSGSQFLWVLPAPVPEARTAAHVAPARGQKNLPPAVVRALTQSGLAALPALAAALGDETLVAVPPGRPGTSAWYPMGESPEDEAQRLFAGLFRPMTRGEIARQLLIPVLPGKAHELERLPSGELAARAMAFWRTQRDNPPARLAGFYLENGSDEQRQQVLELLAVSDDSGLTALFEQRMLEGPDPEGAAGQVRSYVQLKQEKAKGFGRKFLERLKIRLADESIERPRRRHGSRSRQGSVVLSKARLAEHIQTLETLVREEAPEQRMLALLKAEGKTAEEKAGAAEEIVRTLPAAEQVRALVVAAARTPDVELKNYLLRALIFLDQADGEPARPVPPAPDSAEGGAWLGLLKDDALLDGLPRTGGVLLGELAGHAFANTYDDPPAYLLAIARNPKLGVLPRMRERALALLEGKTPPAWPDPGKVGPERFAAIVREAAGMPVERLAAWLQQLTAEEQIAWLLWNWRRAMPEAEARYGFQAPDEPFPEGLQAAARQFASINPDAFVTSAGDAVFLQKVRESLPLGATIDAARLDALAEQFLRDDGAYSGALLLFFPATATGIGWEVTGRKMDAAAVVAAQQQTPVAEDIWQGSLLHEAKQLPQRGDAVLALDWRGTGAGAIVWVRENGVVRKISSDPVPEWRPDAVVHARLVMLSAADRTLLVAVDPLELIKQRARETEAGK